MVGSVLNGGYASLLAEILSKERRIGESQPVRYFFHRKVSVGEQLEAVFYHIVGNPAYRSLAAYMAAHRGEILGSDAQLLGIVNHLAGLLAFVVEQFKKLIEEVLLAVGRSLVGTGHSFVAQQLIADDKQQDA